MTADKFRTLALELPEVEEMEHFGHPDFRVAGKIFATLWPDGVSAMVKLTPAEQTWYVQADPTAFEPVKGAWGKRGCTHVILKRAKVYIVRQALLAAWRGTAPKRLQYEE